MTNTELLQAELDKSGYKISWVAKKMGLSYFGLRKKIDNESQFKAEEIKKLCKILNITSLKLKDAIFFASDVDEMTTKTVAKEVKENEKF